MNIEMEEVVSVIPSHPKMYSLHTTRSWEFAGLKFPTNHRMDKKRKDRDLLLKAKYGKDVIIGLFDTGNVMLSFLCIYIYSL